MLLLIAVKSRCVVRVECLVVGWIVEKNDQEKGRPKE